MYTLQRRLGLRTTTTRPCGDTALCRKKGADLTDQSISHEYRTCKTTSILSVNLAFTQSSRQAGERKRKHIITAKEGKPARIEDRPLVKYNKNAHKNGDHTSRMEPSQRQYLPQCPCTAAAVTASGMIRWTKMPLEHFVSTPRALDPSNLPPMMCQYVNR